MKKAIHDISTGEVVVVDCADSEVTYVPPPPAPTPTKEQLMAQLAALSAQIQALE
jgi:hypothetical protein